MILLAAHEARGLFQIPGALRLVEQCNVFDGRALVDYALIPKVVNVLNKGLDLAQGVTLCRSLPGLFMTLDSIACQRFTENGHQWPIARKKNAVEFVVFIASLRGNC